MRSAMGSHREAPPLQSHHLLSGIRPPVLPSGSCHQAQAHHLRPAKVSPKGDKPESPLSPWPRTRSSPTGFHSILSSSTTSQRCLRTDGPGLLAGLRTPSQLQLCPMLRLLFSTLGAVSCGYPQPGTMWVKQVKLPASSFPSCPSLVADPPPI